ncbi:MAG: endopeptidase La [Firmicutes bacterium]|nr:endopeptidase La [Bacillota bacterium]
MKFNLPVVVLKGTILLPEAEIKLEFDDEVSKNIIDESELFHDNNLLIVTQNGIDENILINELPRIGTIAHITRKLELPNGKVRVVLKGIKRAHILEYINISKDSIESIVSSIRNIVIAEETNRGILRKLNVELENYINKVPYMSNSLLSLISDTTDLNKITDIIVNYLPVEISKKLEYLLQIDPVKRVEMILEDMYKEEQLFNIEKNIDTKVKKELDNDEKNFYLKEKIKLLKSELGETSPKEEEIENLRKEVDELNTSDDIKNKILYEIDRYENMSSMSPELSIVRNYIDFMINLPWNNNTSDIEDFNLIKENLDKSHYALDEVKLRIIEYLAVKKYSSSVDTPIICLVGPPGVGKTTLAFSIAQSIGRKFVKVSVGGVDDEAIIKGHIRTYIGASPGKIIDGIRRAKSSNPVFLIDEIDKMSSNYKGDPRSALLEVLDSNQNKYFKDHYLEEEYDLSNVLFITTANNIDAIPEELKDRLEIININGYTELEKLEIVKTHLIPTICSRHGIGNIKISDGEILNIIRYYTKESGIRELERLISKIVRKIVTNKVISNKRIVLTVKNIEDYLGKKVYEKEEIISEVGIINSLVYTNCGGDITSIEVNHYEGNGNIILTGSLGDVILESAKIALSYIKANYELFNIDYNIFKDDIHINIPNIAIKKEGPSAGISITTALISALSNMSVSKNIAFTGEITLRGNILKIGGLKEKVIGAYINNIDTIFIPFSNVSDLDSIPLEIKEKIKFIPVKKYEEVYKYLKEDKYE